MSTKVLLDTDIGGNIDDALCLAFLLEHDDCDLVGVTSVGGEPERRAMLASTVCWAYGQAMPIVPGATGPLEATQEWPGATQASSLVRWPHQVSFPNQSAAELMISCIESYAGEIVVLTTGPLTNVAQLLVLDPGIVSRVKALVVMGGVFTDERRRLEPWETNTSADPRATQLVYEAKWRSHYSVGLDVTREVVVSAEEAHHRLVAAVKGPVREWAEDWSQDRGAIALNDPLAAAAVFDPGLCRFERGTVSVEVCDAAPCSGISGAATLFEPGDGPHEVAMEVDAERFYEVFWSTLT